MSCEVSIAGVLPTIPGRSTEPPSHTASNQRRNAGPEPRLEAGAQRTLEGVGSRPMLGQALVHGPGPPRQEPGMLPSSRPFSLHGLATSLISSREPG
jgi:hypothetical protein